MFKIVPQQEFISFSFARLACLGLSLAAVILSPSVYAQPVRIAPDLRPLTRPIKTVSDIVLRSQEISTKNVFGKRLVHVRAIDEVWLVSARNQNSTTLGCQRLIDGQWRESSLTELTSANQTSPATPTLVYVHGDRTDDQFGRSRGLQFYENIFNRDECGSSGPVRFVIFIWKAEREIVRPSFDYRLKLVRSVQLGNTFRRFLGQFDGRQMLLVGFSLGGQVILSGISPTTQDAPVCCDQQRTNQYRLALITPSLNSKEEKNCIQPLAGLTNVKETTVFINKNDNALRAARIVNRNDCVDAQQSLSLVAKNCPADAPNQVRIVDMTSEVSPCHSITKYSESSTLLQTELLRLCDEMRTCAEVEIATASQTFK